MRMLACTHTHTHAHTHMHTHTCTHTHTHTHSYIHIDSTQTYKCTRSRTCMPFRDINHLKKFARGGWREEQKEASADLPPNPADWTLPEKVLS